jgi:hypothetical protein
MKLNLKIRGFTRLLAVLLMATPAALVSRSQGADSPPASAAKPPELPARQKLISQFDLDKNGKLEPAEREAYLKHLEDERKKLIQQFDKNGDGALDEEERKAAREFAFLKRLEQKAAAKAAGQTGPQTPRTSSAPTVPGK